MTIWVWSVWPSYDRLLNIKVDPWRTVAVH
jgi:hypothetical protein